MLERRAIARLSTTGNENFAIWVLKAPYPGGYVFHDCPWPQTLIHSWQAWQEMFVYKPLQYSLGGEKVGILTLPPDLVSSPSSPATSYSNRLMQHLGISLWHWLFEGLLFLRHGMTLNGTELAQILNRSRVTLCVVNACWGAQPAAANQQALPRSSLAEVLIHHGIPAVLGMRDEIADQEALSFIQTFAQALRSRLPIDQAVAIARQQLLTLYKFNYPAWTLPVLYLHPDFDGELIRPDEDITQLPGNSLFDEIEQPFLKASLRSLSNPGKVWSLRAGFARVGRSKAENNIVIPEPWVSQQHAEIFCRNTGHDDTTVLTYFLQDNSRFGTLLLGSDGWQKVHRQEVPLQSGMQLKFGSVRGQTFEFIIEM